MSAHDGEVEAFEGKWWQFPPLRNALLAGVIALAVFAVDAALSIPASASIAAYIFAILLGGWHWMREGAEDLFREGKIGIEVLMIAATTGAAILGMWNEAAALVVLYGAAEGLEEFTYARTRASIRSLLDLAPKEARVIREGRELTIAAEDLKVGERFVVRPGEGIVTDGVVVDGTDVLAVYREARRAIEKARAGGGPTLLECLSLRMEGHAVHDDAFYVPKEMFEQWAAQDPIERYRSWLYDNAELTEDEESEITSTVKRLLNDALERAEASPEPDPATLEGSVFASVEDLDTPHHK